jgi:hypothetical protein
MLQNGNPFSKSIPVASVSHRRGPAGDHSQPGSMSNSTQPSFLFSSIEQVLSMSVSTCARVLMNSVTAWA